MQSLEVSGVVQPIYGSLGVKRLNEMEFSLFSSRKTPIFSSLINRRLKYYLNFIQETLTGIAL